MPVAAASHNPEASARDIEAADSADLSAAELIEQLTEQFARGVTVDLDGFLQEHPQHADRLRPLLPALRTLADINRSSTQARSASEGTPKLARSASEGTPKLARSASEGTGDREQASGDQSQTWNFELGTLNSRLGDFRLLRQIGRGGMGIVYEAEQISLKRRVALKILPLAGLLDGRLLQRFKNESQAAASLAHPNIVPIYSVGSEHGLHYYAMQLIDGQSLDRVIADTSPKRERGDSNQRTGGNRDNRETQSTKEIEGRQIAPSFPSLPSVQPASPASSPFPPLPPVQFFPVPSGPQRFRWVAELGIQAAEALQYAHDRGIVHRDIKPGNLLLDKGGKLWITDFGLARIEGDANLTMTGDFLGTLRYMSPEQALGEKASLGHRTDIYSLGATLYELLTLRPSISPTDRATILHHLANVDPTPPRKLCRRIRRDLETVVLKCLAKSPAERYPNARDLADDLRRFLADKPVRARPPTLLHYGLKLTKPHRGLLVASLAALFLGMMLSLWIRRSQQPAPIIAAAEISTNPLAAANEALRRFNDSPVRPDRAISRPLGLVARWSGDGDANDSVGGNHGAPKGGVTFAPGVVGQAFKFDGVSGSVFVPDSYDLDLPTQFTLMAWLNPSSVTIPIDGDPITDAGIVSKVGGPGGQNGYQLALNQDYSTITLNFNAAGEGWPANSLEVTLASPLPIGQWSHIAGTYDGNTMCVYLNGIEIGSKTVGRKTVVSSGSNLRISGDDNRHVYFPGLIDEAAVYNVALTRAEIQASMASP